MAQLQRHAAALIRSRAHMQCSLQKLRALVHILDTERLWFAGGKLRAETDTVI